MRKIKQTGANVRSRKAGSMSLVIVLAIALLSIALIMLSIFLISDVASADTTSAVERTSTYNQLFFSKKGSLVDSSKLNMKSWQDEANLDNSYKFEYIISFHNNSVPADGIPADASEGIGISSTDSLFGVYFGNRIGSRGDFETYFEMGDYNPAGYEYSQTSEARALGDTLYLTVTSDEAFLSLFSVYYDDDFDGENYDEYEISLKHVLFRIEGNTSLHNRLLGVLTSGSATLIYNADYAGKFDFTVTETLNYYKEMEAPVKEGYTFTGWYYDEACTRPYKGEQISEDVKLYAGWKINTYRVFFDGSGLVDPEDPNTQGLYDWITTVEYGSVPEYNPEIDFSSMSIKFGGWYFEDGTKYENTPVVEDMHLYGKFICTISFDVNGGDIELEPIEVEYGSRISAPVPEREGYGFLRWYYYKDVILDGQNFTQLFIFDNSTKVKSDITLIADWYRNVFTVTFYVDNEIWKQVDVKLGATLGSVCSNTSIDKNTVIAFCNENTNTPVASSFEEFYISDDVAVYLGEAKVTDTNSSSNIATTIKSKFADFCNSFKSFYDKIGDWFKNLFKKFKR